MRITRGDLKALLERINKATGHPVAPWGQEPDGKWSASVGTYVLDWAYGGVRLCQLCNESGGERDITQRSTKAETYQRMHAFLAGIEAQTSQGARI